MIPSLLAPSLLCLPEKRWTVVYLGFLNICVPSIVTVCWYVVVGMSYSSLEVDVSNSVFGACFAGISTSG